MAERYARAPSYSEMLADEARAAVRAAEAASKAALHAQAAAQYVLAGLEAASSPEPVWEPQAALDRQPEQQAAPHVMRATEDSPGRFPGYEDSLFALCDELDQPSRQAEPTSARQRPRKQRPQITNAHARDLHKSASAVPVIPGTDDAGEPAQPIHANLIQFPREMVATRKMRPRRAEGPLAAAAPEAQLSIFEVEPGTVSTQPAAAVDEPAAPAWMRTEFESIELEPQPPEELLEEPASRALPHAPIELAPLSRRLLAHVLDASLIVSVFLGVAMLIGANARVLPGPRALGLGAALAMLAIGAAYQTLFLTLSRATPGMRYAGIGLSTLEGKSPSRAQRCGRLMALPLSILPLGLGFVWALFDDGGLTWHDRLSRTYLRKG